MHTKQWQAVCGYVTDVCESVSGSGGTMRELFDLITEDKNSVIYSWTENGRPLYIRRDAFRRKVVSVARKLADCLPDAHGVIGLHLENGPYWPVFYWAILMSGHTPLILDSRHELFYYRSLQAVSGVRVITEDKNYPSVLSPEILKNSRSDVDPAYFDRLWADETLFVGEQEDGTLRLISRSGLALGRQLLRLRHVYQYNQAMFHPDQFGRMRMSVSLPFSDLFGFLCGMVFYPCFGCEQHISAPDADAGRYLASCRSLAVTHLCVSAETCAGMTALVTQQAEKSFPRDASRYLAWLRGEERINDFRILSRFMSFSAKIMKAVFGKKIRCVLCTDPALDETAPHLFTRLGVFFGNGYCVPELGLVSMELSADPEVRIKGSAGILLNGIVGMVLDGRNLMLDCGSDAGQYCTPEGYQPFPSPFPVGARVAFDRNNRLLIAQDHAKQSSGAQQKADPETVLKMRELYAAVLNKPLDIIDEDMDFFAALGGDSLSYFLLLQHIELLFGIQIKPEERIYFSTARYAAETLKPYTQAKKGEVKNHA